MSRLNFALLLALLASAFYLVNVQYESRRLYMALSKAKSQALRLEADHEQLVVQQRAQASPGRVQQIAAAQLQMRPATPAVTEYVQLPAPAQASAAKGQP